MVTLLQVPPLLQPGVVVEGAGLSGKEEIMTLKQQVVYRFYLAVLEVTLPLPLARETLSDVHIGHMILKSLLVDSVAGVDPGMQAVEAVDTVVARVVPIQTSKAAGAAARTTRTAWAMRGLCIRLGMRACLGSPRRGFRGVM